MVHPSRASSHRIAFYPCCASDAEEPRILLRDYADEIIFCDIKGKRVHRRTNVVRGQSGLPTSTFIVGDVREIVPNLPSISALFYRRDGVGEGGSGVFILGDSVLPRILKRFPAEGGLIITDGSNSRGGNFRKMIRQNGLNKHGWNFAKLAEQPLVDTHRLWLISVTPALNADANLRDPAM
jgi:hypothetical protein